MEDIPNTTQPQTAQSPVTPVPEQSVPVQSIQPSPEPSLIPTEPPPTPPKKKSFPRLVILIFLIVSVLIIGLVLLKKTSPSTTKINQQSSTIESTPVPAGKAGAQQTYTNSTNKFSIQYPSDLQLKETSIGMGVSSVDLRSPDNLDTSYLADIQMLTLPKYIGKTIGQDFDEYYAMSENTSKTISAQGLSRTITKMKNRSVNNQRAFDFKSTASPADPNEEPTIGVYVEMGDNILIISTPEHNKDKLEQMLANFKYPL